MSDPKFAVWYAEFYDGEIQKTKICSLLTRSELINKLLNVDDEPIELDENDIHEYEQIIHQQGVENFSFEKSSVIEILKAINQLSFDTDIAFGYIKAVFEISANEIIMYNLEDDKFNITKTRLNADFHIICKLEDDDESIVAKAEIIPSSDIINMFNDGTKEKNINKLIKKYNRKFLDETEQYIEIVHRFVITKEGDVSIIHNYNHKPSKHKKFSIY